MSTDKAPKIRVLVRKRPLSKKQQLKGENDIITIQSNQSVIVRQQKFKVDLTPYIDEYKFNFDGAYDQHATNEQIYYSSIRPLVDCAFDGARVSCFAYGQTGSGKTYTMLGDGANVKGLYLLAAFDIFQQLGQHQKLSVWISFYQIYCGKLYDLLNDRNVLFARQDAKNNVNIVGLSQRKITSVQNIMQIIQFGTGVRVTAQNGTNVDSSRSHAILQISLKNNNNKLHGKISFIDLAGSERAADHADQLQKQTRIDGAQINKSLLALKQCIRALDQNKNHTPFRGSKLTMVLKDSFTGYCRTVMIGNISPNSTSSQNTLNTLKYADRVKQLKKPNKQFNYQMAQIDNLDQLSKQLMLPRQMVNHKKYNNYNPNGTNNQHGANYNQCSNQQHKGMQRQNNQYTSNFSHQQNYKSSNQQPPLFVKNPKLTVPHKNQNYGNQLQRNSPNTKQRSHSNSQGYNASQYQSYNSHSQQHANNFNNNNRNSSNPSTLVQQQQPPYDTHDMGNQHFQALSKKHQNFIQLVIDQQQQLMSCHQQHINSTIQLVKKQMFLMNEADKIGSNIEKYLDDLDQVLELELASIYAVRERVHRLKRDLRESQKLEKMYIQESNKLYGGHDEILLDDDQHLFH